MVFSQGLLEHADALTLESPNPKSFMNPTASSASRSRTNASQSHTKRGTAEARYGMSPAPKPVRHKTPPKKQAPVERSPFKSLDRVTRRQSLPPPCPFNEADSMRDDENSLRANESPPQSPAKAKPATQAVPPSPLRPGLLSPVRRPANTKVNAQWISYYVKHGRLAEARKLGWEGPPEGTATATTTSSQPQPPGVELHDSSEDRFARRSSQGVAWTSPGAAPAAAPAPAAVATPGSELGRDPAGGTAFFVRLDAGIEVLRAFANEGTDTGAAVGNDKAAGEEAGAEEWLEAYDKVEATEAEATEAEATEAEVTEEWLAAYDKAEGEAPEEGAPEAWLEADAERLEKQVQRGQPAPGVARAAAKEVAAKVAGLAHWQALASADSHRSHRTEAEETAHAVEAAAATIAATEATEATAEAAAQAQGAPSLVSATCDRAARPRRSRLLVLVLVPVLAAALALAPTLTLPLARTRTLLRTLLRSLLRTRCSPPCSLAACAAPRAP